MQERRELLAFNHPLNLIVHQVGPAVATGCPCIVKPAEATPTSGMRFVAILREAGLPEAWCQALVTTDLDVAGSLATDRRVGFFSFISSARVGWILRSKLASGTRCALEHGGAAPVLVAEDADFDRALPLISKGGFYHAGQVCVSVQRVFVHRSIARDVAERLAEVPVPSANLERFLADAEALDTFGKRRRGCGDPGLGPRPWPRHDAGPHPRRSGRIRPEGTFVFECAASRGAR